MALIAGRSQHSGNSMLKQELQFSTKFKHMLWPPCCAGVVCVCVCVCVFSWLLMPNPIELLPPFSPRCVMQAAACSNGKLRHKSCKQRRANTDSARGSSIPSE